MIGDCLNIKRIWSDDDMIELVLTAKTACASSTINLYVTDNDILEWKHAFIEFPKDITDTYEWSIGDRNGNSLNYFRMKLSLYNKLGGAAIEIELDNHLAIPWKVLSHFYIPTEVSAINSFGSKLNNLLMNDFVEIEGITLISV